ncbi:hypothetical protein MTO96_051611 [Rhipicephalus appendiculatus]
MTAEKTGWSSPVSVEVVPTLVLISFLLHRREKGEEFWKVCLRVGRRRDAWTADRRTEERYLRLELPRSATLRNSDDG